MRIPIIGGCAAVVVGTLATRAGVVGWECWLCILITSIIVGLIA